MSRLLLPRKLLPWLCTALLAALLMGLPTAQAERAAGEAAEKENEKEKKWLASAPLRPTFPGPGTTRPPTSRPLTVPFPAAPRERTVQDVPQATPSLLPSSGPTSRTSEVLQLGPYRLPGAMPGEKAVLILQSGAGSTPLTYSQLLTLPRFRLVTQHAQLQKTFAYEGVLLRTLARAMGIEGQNLRIYAQNGFVSTISAADYEDAPIMLAYLANGQPISIRNKGPLTVVLPSDDRELQGKSAYWVWFVERITPAP